MSGVRRNPDEAQANLFDPRISFHSIRATTVDSGEAGLAFRWTDMGRNPQQRFRQIVARMKRSGIRETISIPGAHFILSGCVF